MAVKEISSGKVRITVRVTKELYDKLRKEAAERNLSVNEMVELFAEEKMR